jgi:hypothetical protein
MCPAFVCNGSRLGIFLSVHKYMRRFTCEVVENAQCSHLQGVLPVVYYNK